MACPVRFCADCDMGLIDFAAKFKGEMDSLIHLAVSHGLIASHKVCGKCNSDARMDISKKKFRCHKRVSVNKQKKTKCNWSQSIYKGTWFHKARLDIETVLMFCNVYLRDGIGYKFLRDEFKLTDHTICDWSSFVREVLVSWCVKREGKIGGPGQIVEIDESKFGRRKYNVGRIIEGQWVFGGICRETRSVFMVPVKDRTSQTLLKIIKERVVEGTTIISDCWSAYGCLSEEGYEHLTVNHTYNFVDPDTLAHTNTIERQWREAKRKVPLFGRRKKHFVGYLARCMFQMAIPETNKRFHTFLEATAALYPPQ